MGEAERLASPGAGTDADLGWLLDDLVTRVAQIDKTTANVISDNQLSGVSPPSDWAFSFWGGDFYLYAAPGTNSTGNRETDVRKAWPPERRPRAFHCS